MRIHTITLRFDEDRGGFSCEVSCAGDEGAAPREPAPPPAKSRPSQPTRDLDDAQRALFEALRTWRARRAEDEGVPPYVILTNRQLAEVAQRTPQSPTALAKIDGIGAKKVERHGEALLQTLRDALAQRGQPATADREAAP